jgi:hypothetical protein
MGNANADKKIKHKNINMDDSSDEDMPLMAKLKRRMSVNVKNHQLEIEK